MFNSTRDIKDTLSFAEQSHPSARLLKMVQLVPDKEHGVSDKL
jgi:hypothetical protein